MKIEIDYSILNKILNEKKNRTTNSQYPKSSCDNLLTDLFIQNLESIEDKSDELFYQVIYFQFIVLSEWKSRKAEHLDSCTLCSYSVEKNLKDIEEKLFRFFSK